MLPTSSRHITLIRPPVVSARNSYSAPVTPPVALAYLAAALRANGFSVTPIDALGERIDQVRSYEDPPCRVRGLTIAETVALVPAHTSLIGISCMFSQAWLFVRPGLYRREQRFVYFLVPGSTVLTMAGLSLMYFVMLPLMLRILVLFGTSLHLGGATAMDPRIAAAIEGSPDIRVQLANPEAPSPGDIWLRWPQMEMYVAVVPNDPDVAAAVEILRVPTPSGSIISQEFRLTTYINFVLLLMLGIAVAFQMPLVILLMGWMGLVSEKELRAKRKYAFFACAATAAVITPADAMSMIIMLIPLVALYELSILLLVIVPASRVAEGTLLQRRRKKN